MQNLIKNPPLLKSAEIWSRNLDGEEGKQLSVGETGALITEVAAPLVSTKEHNFWGDFFAFSALQPRSLMIWEQSRILKYFVRRT